jgi:putative membrane protein
MKDLAQKWLSEKDRKQIDATVQTAEKRTSGEIVCLIQSASYHYPMADLLGGVTLALPLALVVTPYGGKLLWLGDQNMWLFLGIFAALFAVSYFLVRHIPGIKRRFISTREIDEEVHEAAVNAFFHNRLYRTKESNGVLLFISVFEHRVWVLADHGIDAKVDQQEWDKIVAGVTDGIKQNQAVEAICRAIREIGKMLETHFPVNPNDIDELENLIVTED